MNVTIVSYHLIGRCAGRRLFMVCILSYWLLKFELLTKAYWKIEVVPPFWTRVENLGCWWIRSSISVIRDVQRYCEAMQKSSPITVFCILVRKDKKIVSSSLHYKEFIHQVVRFFDTLEVQKNIKWACSVLALSTPSTIITSRSGVRSYVSPCRISHTSVIEHTRSRVRDGRGWLW